MLGCINKGITRRDKVIIPQYSALARPHMEYCVQLWSLLYKIDVDRLEKVQRRATKMIKGQRSCHMRKRKLRGHLITLFQYLKGGYKEDGTPFLQGVRWKRQGVIGIGYSWGDSDWTQEENFSQGEQSDIGIISPGKWWVPKHWTLLRFGWTGCWAILSRPCFCRERLDQMILELPSNLVFYDSMNLKRVKNHFDLLQLCKKFDATLA